MKVRELMTRFVESCQSGTDLAAVAMTMWREDCGIVPVVDENRRVLGVLTDRDLCMAVATRHRRPEELRAGDVMSGKLFSVGPDDNVQVALETMRTQHVRRLPVVDAEGRIEGILSMNDIVLRARPSGARPTAGLSANEVLAVLQGICAHLVPARRPSKFETPEMAHA